MRKFFEKIVEGGLLISGSVSSFTILLIVFFLFKEAGGLFNTPATEEGYVLAVNKSNDVGKLSPEKIMDIFDGNITNWKDISGMDQDILIFRFSDLTNYYTEEELGDEFQYVPQKISELVAKEPGIIAFFPKQYLLENGFQGKDGQKVPEMTPAIVQSISDRYIELFENITGEKFVKEDTSNIAERIEKNVMNFLTE